MSGRGSELQLQSYGDNNGEPLDHNSNEYKPLEIARSHDVRYLQITIPNEILNDAIRHLGDCGRLHVVDISAQSSGDVSKYIFAYKKRATDLGDLQKKLRSFEEQCKVRNVQLEIADFSHPLGLFGEQLTARNPDLLVGAQEFIVEAEARLLNNIAFERNVQQEIARRVELSVTLDVASRLVPQSLDKVNINNQQGTVMDQYMNNQNYAQNEDDLEAADGPLSSFICGVIPMDNVPMFSRLVYRTSKGANAVLRFEAVEQPIIDPATGVGVKKAVFCVATIGRQLHRRIAKLCPTVGATIYPINTFDPAFVSAERSRLEGEIQEQKLTLDRTSAEISDILSSLAAPQVIDGIFGPCTLHAWQQLLYIESVMINVLMQCAFHATFVVLGAWVPTEFVHDVVTAVDRCAEGGSSGAKPMIDYQTTPTNANSTPPTYIPTTTFTNSFQSLINTYGIPTYKEFNPALVAMGTFPFLFGVMFGDIGHGSILLLLAIFLISKEAMFEQQRKNKTMNEMIDMVYGARYFLVMMSCMAIYCGFVYNDFMAVPLNIFGRQYQEGVGWKGVYPFGVDPSWYHRAESLKFFNSLKMKMAVIIGVIHMLSGLVISLLNHIHFKDHVSLIFEFIPRVIFLLVTFGWMISMIVIKWCINWDTPARGIGNAPSIIQMMINMFLAPGGEIKPEAELVPGQSGLQLIFVLIAVILIPILWFAKPIIEFKKMKAPFMDWCHSPVDDKRERSHSSSHGNTELLSSLDGASHGGDSDATIRHGSSDSSDDDHHEEHTFGDVIVHHSIHTIEFILGVVSNTASYLRLWALSLAHAQLSEVFWTKMMTEYGFASPTLGMSAVGCLFFALSTFMVICCMDSLECFLHTLRLHWVESMGKHYTGTGIKFKPYNFLEEEDE